jgi:hypothetical protein
VPSGLHHGLMVLASGRVHSRSSLMKADLLVRPDEKQQSLPVPVTLIIQYLLELQPPRRHQLLQQCCSRRSTTKTQSPGRTL